MIFPPVLQPGDTIAIVAPAKAIEADHVHFAQRFLEERGFKALISEHCLGQYHYFSGTIEDRKHDFQRALNEPKVKAILCARGGYGCVQIVDKLDWSRFEKNPKWIIGFSDVTMLHHHIQQMGIASIHGTMPLNFSTNTEEALSTLIEGVTSKQATITCESDKHNIVGTASGELVGGNLSIVYSLLGTESQIDYDGKILFIEDLCEHLYAIDRMFHSLRKAGVLDAISGLVVGGMTDMMDTTNGFGQTLEEIIIGHMKGKNTPVAFSFPAGHIDDNRALVFGTNIALNVDENKVTLKPL